MKKMVFSCVALAACAGAYAQSTVTLYGVVDEYVEYASNGAAHATRLQSGGIYGSRLGFRGREDLGGGYAGIFTLEMGINADDGSLGQGGLAFGRQAFVGVSTPYGDITLGRHNTPHFFAITYYSMAGGLSYGNAANYYTDLAVTRVNNSVVFQSKKYGGFSGQAMYAFGETVGSTSLNSFASAYLAYAEGPVSAGAAFARKKVSDTNTDLYLVTGASYDFGFVKPGVLISNRRDDNNTHESNMAAVSAAIPVGAFSSAYVDVGHIKNKSLANADSSSFSLRYDYYLSKRTTVYGGFVKIKNQAGASYGVNGATGAALAVAAGQDPKSIVVGVRHTF